MTKEQLAELCADAYVEGYRVYMEALKQLLSNLELLYPEQLKQKFIDDFLNEIKIKEEK